MIVTRYRNRQPHAINVRAGPGVQHRSVRQVPAAHEVCGIGEPVPPSAARWVQLLAGGYVRSDLVRALAWSPVRASG